MEVQGIGRPATYAATVMTLFTRDYIKTEKKALVPTELGVQVTKYLEEYFQNIMNIKFTAEMEEQLDNVELGKHKWQDIVDVFYKDFNTGQWSDNETNFNIIISLSEIIVKYKKTATRNQAAA